MTALAFTRVGWVMYIVTVPYVFGWGLTGPAIQAIVTRSVPKNEQGILQGAMSSVGTFTGVVGPPIAGALFGYFISPTPRRSTCRARPSSSVRLMFVAGLLFTWQPSPELAAAKDAAADRSRLTHR